MILSLENKCTCIGYFCVYFKCNSVLVRGREGMGRCGEKRGRDGERIVGVGNGLGWGK